MARIIRVYGYHGTSAENAQQYLERGFPPHSLPGDWLGDGIYFWQDAPARALEWATFHYPSEPAVIGTEIALYDCLDLLDIVWERRLLVAYEAYRRQATLRRRRLPTQKGGFHNLDREVINFAVRFYSERGAPIRAVRAAFQEGRRIFPRSALYARSHVQIAVRDPSLIADYWLEPNNPS
jgi:transposase InsO family protein